MGEAITTDKVTLRDCATDDMMADPMTKELGKTKHDQHCGGRGVPRLEGARLLSCGQHTPRGHPQNIPIRASKGMTRPNLREIGSARGRGSSLVVFPTPLLLV